MSAVRQPVVRQPVVPLTTPPRAPITGISRPSLLAMVFWPCCCGPSTSLLNAFWINSGVTGFTR